MQITWPSLSFDGSWHGKLINLSLIFGDCALDYNAEALNKTFTNSMAYQQVCMYTGTYAHACYINTQKYVCKWIVISMYECFAENILKW